MTYEPMTLGELRRLINEELADSPDELPVVVVARDHQYRLTYGVQVRTAEDWSTGCKDERYSEHDGEPLPEGASYKLTPVLLID